MNTKPPTKKKHKRSKDLGGDEQGLREQRWLERAARRGQNSTSSDGFDREARAKIVNKEADGVDADSPQTRRSLATTGRLGGVGGLGLKRPSAHERPSSQHPLRPGDAALPSAAQINLCARERVKRMARHYSTRAGWRSPHPEILGNKSPEQAPIPGSQDQHKDLYLCLDILFATGFAVPLIDVNVPDLPAGKWYPDALDLPQCTRGSDRVLHLIAQDKLRGKNQKARHLRIGKVLAPGRPGDIVLAEYLAEDGSVYGLTWLMIEVDTEAEQAPNQWTLVSADEGGARILELGVAHFSYAESLLLLRPVRAWGSIGPRNKLKTFKVFS